MKSTRPLSVSIRALLITLGATAASQAQTSIIYQAPTGPGGSWNIYEYVLTGANWATAHNASNGIALPAGIPGPGPLGYLVDIESAQENAIVNNMGYRNDFWIGLTDRAGVVPGASEGNFVWTSGVPL